VATVKKKTVVKAKKIGKKTATKKAAPKKTTAKKKTLKKTAAKKPAAKTPVAKKPAAKTPVAKTRLKPDGIPEQMLKAALTVLDERQAQDVVTVSLEGRSSLADYMIIASGRAGRQIVALADYLREAFFKLGVRDVKVEGQSDANWVLVDAGDVIVHLFLPEVRHYYDLDSLWAKAPKK